ncbi:MAG: universal stress protein [Deltaproteobacteria bacterium]|nr:universal stress protein [Deltaproteobacteria bacterium]MBW2418405.1 universal stress protein [Deltaproteobacteria bacterium]
MSEEASDTDGRLATIVAATDFSPTAELALERAKELAREHGARVVLAHAITLQPFAAGGPELGTLPSDFEYQVREASVKRLENLAEAIRGEGIDVETKVHSGLPAGMANSVAAEVDADLMVIGTRGLSGFKHLVLGSTAEEIIRHAPCPVLTVHPGDAHALDRLAKVLVPTDFSEDALRAAREVTHLFRSQAGSAHILLVHAGQLPPLVQPILEELSFEPFTIEDLAASARERLEAEAERIRAAGFEVEVVVRVGDPAAVITELVASEGVSLVAMGTRGHSGLKHLLLGSTAERVVQHAACPVLTVRREH